jgi:polyferredoxin
MNKQQIIGIILMVISSWLFEFAFMQSVNEVVRLNVFFLFLTTFGAIFCAILYRFGILQQLFADFGKLEIKDD